MQNGILTIVCLKLLKLFSRARPDSSVPRSSSFPVISRGELSPAEPARQTSCRCWKGRDRSLAWVQLCAHGHSYFTVSVSSETSTIAPHLIVLLRCWRTQERKRARDTHSTILQLRSRARAVSSSCRRRSSLGTGSWFIFFLFLIHQRINSSRAIHSYMSRVCLVLSRHNCNIQSLLRRSLKHSRNYRGYFILLSTITLQ